MVVNNDLDKPYTLCLHYLHVVEADLPSTLLIITSSLKLKPAQVFVGVDHVTIGTRGQLQTLLSPVVTTQPIKYIECFI